MVGTRSRGWTRGQDDETDVDDDACNDGFDADGDGDDDDEDEDVNRDADDDDD